MARQSWDALTCIGKCLLPLFLTALAGCGSGDGGATGATGTAQATLNDPGINGTPTAQVQVGQAYSFTPATSDPGNLQLGFNIQNKPSWATFNTGTGQLTGTPVAGDVGSYANVSISVTNGQSTAALPAFSIAVLPQHSGTATLSWAAPTTTTTGAALTNLAGYTIAYGSSGTNLNQTVSLTDPATTTYTVQNLTAGTWYFTVAAYTSDGLQSSSSNVASLGIQ
jgi:hypothetical protein